MLFRRHCTGFFSLQCYVESLGQHCISFWPVQCCPENIKTTLNKSFLVQCCLEPQGQQENYLCNVGPECTDIVLQENNWCNIVLNIPGPTLHKTITVQCWSTVHRQRSHTSETTLCGTNYLYNAGAERTVNFSQEHNLLCLDLPGLTLHKKSTCAMLTHSPETTLHKEIIQFCLDLYGATLHKEITCAMLAHD